MDSDVVVHTVHYDVLRVGTTFAVALFYLGPHGASWLLGIHRGVFGHIGGHLASPVRATINKMTSLIGLDVQIRNTGKTRSQPSGLPFLVT